MTPKYFMNQCKKIAQANGWNTGYEASGDTNATRQAIIKLAKLEGFYNKNIGHHFPNNGTFTYDDGVIDFTLGALNPLSEVAIELNKAGIPFTLTL